MATEVFKLLGSIFIDNEKANKNIDQTTKKGQGFAQTFSKGIATAAKWGAAVVAGAAAAGGALLATANKAAQTTDRIDKMSQQLGFSRQAFQEWDFILSQNGVSIDSLGSGMKSLTNQVDDLSKGGKVAVGAFSELGLKYEDLEGLSREEIFEKTIVALQGVEDETKRAAIANDLLGRSGQDLAPLLNAGAGSVEELREKAKELGIVLSDDAVDAGVKYTDTMDQLKRSFGAVFTQVGVMVMPIIQSFAEWITDHMPQIQAVMQTVFGAIGDVISWLSDNIIKPLAGHFQESFGGASGAVSIFKDEVLPVIDTVKNIIMGFVELVTIAWNRWGDDILSIVETAFNTVWDVVQNVLNIILGIVDVFVGLFTGDWERAKKGVIEIFNNLFSGLKSIVLGAWDILKTAFHALFDDIAAAFGGLVDSAKGWGMDLILGIWNGIKEKWNSLKSTVTGFFSGIGDTIKGVFGISSPSKMFMEIGGNISEGLAKGIEDGAQLAERATSGLAGAVTGGFSSPASGASELSRSGDTLIFQPGAITIDAKNIREFNDIIRIAKSAKSKQRLAFGTEVG